MNIQHKRTNDMYNKFTGRARRIMHVANQEARHLGHENIGIHHVLIAMLIDAGSVAAKALRVVGIRDVNALREAVRTHIPDGNTQFMGSLPHTVCLKIMLKGAADAAIKRNSQFIGTEHLLLGLVHMNTNAVPVPHEMTILVRTFIKCGVDIDQIEPAIDTLLMNESDTETIPFRAADADVLESVGQRISESYMRNKVAKSEIAAIHAELSTVLNDASDGQNWLPLISNIKSAISKLTEENVRLQRLVKEPAPSPFYPIGAFVDPHYVHLAPGVPLSAAVMTKEMNPQTDAPINSTLIQLAREHIKADWWPVGLHILDGKWRRHLPDTEYPATLAAPIVRASYAASLIISTAASWLLDNKCKITIEPGNQDVQILCNVQLTHPDGSVTQGDTEAACLASALAHSCMGVAKAIVDVQKIKERMKHKASNAALADAARAYKAASDNLNFVGAAHSTHGVVDFDNPEVTAAEARFNDAQAHLQKVGLSFEMTPTHTPRNSGDLLRTAMCRSIIQT